MDREDYMRCSMELNDHFEGRSQISGAACLFASTAIKELLDRAEEAEIQLKDVKERLDAAYWAAWAGDFQATGEPENEQLHHVLQDVMLALKGQIQARPEREQAVKTAEKELGRAERSLDGAKKRGAPACDIENLEKKVAYKRLVLELIRRE